METKDTRDLGSLVDAVFWFGWISDRILSMLYHTHTPSQVYICLVLAVSFSLCSEAVGQDADWNQFLGPLRNGTSAETDILKDWSEDKLKLNWTLPVGQGYAVGSVADGNYFHFDAIEKDGESLARLRKVDLHSGKTAWTIDTPLSYKDQYGYDSGPRASPLIHDGKVYVYGVAGKLRCLNVGNGETIWEVDTLKKFGVIQNFFGVSGCPLIYENLLLVGVGGSPEESKNVPPGQLNLVKPNGSAVIAFDRETGKEVWRSGDDLASYSSLRVVQMHGEPIVLAWMRDHLLAMKPGDGKQLFKFKWRARKLESVNASTPVVFENKIYLGESYQKGGVVIEVSEAWEPTILWSDAGKRDQSLAPHWNTPILHEGFLYGCSGESTKSAELRCVDFLTGKVQWTKKGLGRSSVTLCDGHLLVMAERGKLLLVEATPEQFSLVTQYEGDTEFRYPCWSAPVVSGGKLIIKGKQKVACFELMN